MDAKEGTGAYAEVIRRGRGAVCLATSTRVATKGKKKKRRRKVAFAVLVVLSALEIPLFRAGESWSETEARARGEE